MKKIGIIGPNNKMCSKELYDFGVQLGRHIATKDRTFVCGGLGGFMEAVCKGVKLSSDTFNGQTVGILPDDTSDNANPFIDTAVATGQGIARNIIIVRTADIIIAAGGGAGTLSEIAFAWQLEKKVLCVTLFEGWAKELAGKNLDDRQNGLLIPVNSIDEILKHLDNG
ncbi:MAG: TIGR00725 family protein [Saprospiraceae bacterium]|nr:TIGR00725 family protein [Saprospiraceae bacterium]MCF8249734.1 TIGR00725 family protein [Saprospiraceae bacterium]MCF8279219.1 TIGR00725 family protein [Bacteroidales bacterium]MCF8312767.1 TIGR00725 family protein [Saprospiraceae bacterium]MCF8441214.1 TIGR00725 family protein [Saprospiraceae bacterium]